MFLDYFALVLIFFVALSLFYGIIALHDIPYEIAHKRNHPHQDAIHAAGWVSLFTLHAIWPFLWIWAMLYDPERGWSGLGTEPKVKLDVEGAEPLAEEVKALRAEVAELKGRLEAADTREG